MAHFSSDPLTEAVPTCGVTNMWCHQAFGQYATQKEVFTTVVSPIIDEVLEGFNCTVFAYGQTGTGKTHTMEGNMDDPENAGIIPRAVQAVFQHLEAAGAEYSVRLSFLELYNEVRLRVCAGVALVVCEC